MKVGKDFFDVERYGVDLKRSFGVYVPNGDVGYEIELLHQPSILDHSSSFPKSPLGMLFRKLCFHLNDVKLQGILISIR